MADCNLRQLKRLKMIITYSDTFVPSKFYAVSADRLRMFRIHWHHDTFNLCIVLKGILAFFSPPAACLVTAKRTSHVEVIVAIDPNSPCVQIMRHCKSSAHISRADTSYQSKAGRVGSLNGLCK